MRKFSTIEELEAFDVKSLFRIVKCSTASNEVYFKIQEQSEEEGIWKDIDLSEDGIKNKFESVEYCKQILEGVVEAFLLLIAEIKKNIVVNEEVVE